MKKLRLHLSIILGFFVVCFVLGSFFDLEISKAVYSSKNGFGLFISSIGTLPGYMIFSFLGGGFLTLALRKQYPLWANIILYVVCAVTVGLTTYFAGREFFSSNGWDIKNLVWLGYLISLPFALLGVFLGYKVFSTSERKDLLFLLIVFVIFIFLALIPGVVLLKSIFHRPRFRSIVAYNQIDFHAWYEPCKNYKDLMKLTELTSEEFKSFPSGHAGASALLVMAAVLMPLISKKADKYLPVILYCGLAWSMLVSFSRILVGAHFLSDVSMGSILTILMALIANEVVLFKERKTKQN